MEHERRHPYTHIGVGIFLLIVGVALLLNNFDIFNARPVWHYWPVILIAIGLGRLMDAQQIWEYRKAFWLLFLGAWFLVSELRLFGLSYHDSWPLLLIGVGIGMIWKSAYPSNYRMVKDHCNGN
jgi:predicted tellurium resistance membrane protein TerC